MVINWRPVAPAVGKLPPEWKERGIPWPIPAPSAQRAFQTRHLTVIMDCSLKDDGKFWLHVSVSRQDRVPNYEELCEIKRLFIGEDREAYHVWPRTEKHVNLHPRCLHLWSPVEHSPLPDFSGVVPGIGRSI